jgi:hypothetical protein
MNDEMTMSCGSTASESGGEAPAIAAGVGKMKNNAGQPKDGRTVACQRGTP